MEGYKKGWYVPFLLAIVDKTNLCTRADNAVQKVKSGKFKLIGMNVNGLSGFNHLYGVDSSFIFLFLWVLPEPYFQEMWIRRVRTIFLSSAIVLYLTIY